MKSKIYALLGIFFITFGATYINFGLGLMVLGAVFMLESYLKFDKENNGDQET